MILVLLIAGLILGISYMFTRSDEQQESITAVHSAKAPGRFTRSDEQQESITGTLTLSSDDKTEPINIGDNVDLNYNYITNPNKLDQRDISADGLIVFGDKVNEYMNKMGYTRTELTITNIKKESSILNADMQINDSSEYLHVEYDYTANDFQFNIFSM